MGLHAPHGGHCQSCPRWCGRPVRPAQHRRSNHRHQRHQSSRPPSFHLSDLYQSKMALYSSVMSLTSQLLWGFLLMLLGNKPLNSILNLFTTHLASWMASRNPPSKVAGLYTQSTPLYLLFFPLLLFLLSECQIGDSGQVDRSSLPACSGGEDQAAGYQVPIGIQRTKWSGNIRCKYRSLTLRMGETFMTICVLSLSLPPSSLDRFVAYCVEGLRNEAVSASAIASLKLTARASSPCPTSASWVSWPLPSERSVEEREKKKSDRSCLIMPCRSQTATMILIFFLVGRSTWRRCPPPCFAFWLARKPLSTSDGRHEKERK